MAGLRSTEGKAATELKKSLDTLGDFDPKTFAHLFAYNTPQEIQARAMECFVALAEILADQDIDTNWPPAFLNAIIYARRIKQALDIYKK